MRQLVAALAGVALAGCAATAEDANYRGWVESGDKSAARIAPAEANCRTWLSDSDGLHCISQDPIQITLTSAKASP